MYIYVIEVDENDETKTIGFASTREKAETMLEMYKNSSEVQFIDRELIYQASVDFIGIDGEDVAV